MIEERPNGSSEEPIIICRDVHKWFGQFHVLRGVTTTVNRSEKLVVVGPSGVGQVHLHPHHQPPRGAPAR